MLELTGFFSIPNQIERMKGDTRTPQERRNAANARSREQSNMEVLEVLGDNELTKQDIAEASGLAMSTTNEVLKRLLAEKRIRIVRTFSRSGNKVHVYAAVESCE